MLRLRDEGRFTVLIAALSMTGVAYLAGEDKFFPA